MLILILLSILLLFGVVKYILHMRHMESYVKHLHIKQPVYPLLGNSLEVVGKTPQKLFVELVDYVKENSTPYKSYFGPVLVITIDRPDDFKTILMNNNCLDKPYFYGFYPSKVGLMSATSSAIWKPIRKLMNPSFNLKILQSFFPIFNEKTKILVENIERELGKPHFDINKYTSACTLDLVSKTTMGYDVNVQRNQNHDFLQGIEAFFDIVGQRFIKFWTHLDFLYRWTALYKEQQKHLNNFHKLTKHIYRIKKEEFITQNKYKLIEESDSGEVYGKPQILIDRLLSLVHERKIDDQTAIEEVETMLIGGTETSALTTSYVVLLLAMYPEIQERVYDELKTVYKTQDEDTSYEHLQKLSYLDRVIKESLRLLPVGSFLVRRAIGDVEISNCTIPKDSYVLLSIFNLHRRVDIWGKSSDQFNPDNFLPENVSKRHPFSFIPFSTGPRNCIGYLYGTMSVKTMLSAILRHYKFTTNLKLSELEMRFAISTKLCNGHMVGVEKRVW
ncbi:cytochrome P450 4C1-like [Contarinia nasturtii]|uniref:cytochrome P450 4C1-like n=1 Tax=Contarinia nasturtii TaxID=265458 RepID=UPI0012D3EFE7|nr:cytochrome P450 4C1-like [Contarinia nasturtii]